MPTIPADTEVPLLGQILTGLGASSYPDTEVPELKAIIQTYGVSVALTPDTEVPELRAWLVALGGNYNDGDTEVPLLKAIYRKLGGSASTMPDTEVPLLAAILSLSGTPATPPVLVTPPSLDNFAPSFGDTITRIPGVYTGSPAPTLTGKWQRDLVDIAPSQTGSSYVAVQADVGHKLSYLEHAQNTAGSLDTSTAQTADVVAVFPGAPTIGMAVATGSVTADVPFTAPASNGGSVIVSYTATSTPGGVMGAIFQAGSGTIAMNGLDPGTSYTFTVHARNSIGDGPESAASNSITTFTVPDAPTIGTAVATGSTTADVPFTAPASDGGSTILSYTATSTPGSITGTLVQAGSGTIAVTGLDPDTDYTFTVHATNAIGDSAESASSNSITTDPASSFYADYPLIADGDDVSGNGRNLSNIGGVTFDATDGATFDGTNWLFRASPFLDTAGDRSGIVWVNGDPTTIGAHARLVRVAADDSEGFTVYSEPPTGLAFFFVNPTGPVGAVAFDNTWHMIKWRYTLSTHTGEIGVDDGGMTTSDLCGTMADNTGGITLGGQDFPYTGQMKGAKLQDSLLSDGEFDALFALGPP